MNFKCFKFILKHNIVLCLLIIILKFAYTLNANPKINKKKGYKTRDTIQMIVNYLCDDSNSINFAQNSIIKYIDHAEKNIYEDALYVKEQIKKMEKKIVSEFNYIYDITDLRLDEDKKIDKEKIKIIVQIFKLNTNTEIELLDALIQLYGDLKDKIADW